MAYKDPIKEKAFQMYAKEDTKQAEIAKTLKISRETIGKWVKKHNWKERKEKIEENARQKADKKYTDWKVSQIDTARLEQEMYNKKLMNNQIMLTPQDNDRSAKREMLLMGEATERTEGTIALLRKAYDEVMEENKDDKD